MHECIPDVLRSQDFEVSTLLLRPERAEAFLVLAHGAGAGFKHTFMEGFAQALADVGVASLRYNFPYMESGGFPPNRPAILVDAVSAATARGLELSGDLPVFAGGKSMGGRMTSTAASQGRLPGAVEGLVFVGFPLHPAGRPGTDRAEHLADVTQPMLFLQGSRDKLATPGLLLPVLAALGDQAEIQMIEDADHGFHVPKRSGRTDDEVIVELAERAARFMRNRRRS